MRPHESVRKRLEAREAALAPAAMRSADSRGRVTPRAAVGHAHGVPARPRPHHPLARRSVGSSTRRRCSSRRRATTTSRASRTRSKSRRSRAPSPAASTSTKTSPKRSRLGHDLGHTPFGHAGEQALGELLPDGFRHNEQSAAHRRHCWSAAAQGLNLTWEVREGILKHSKPREGIFDELRSATGRRRSGATRSPARSKARSCASPTPSPTSTTTSPTPSAPASSAGRPARARPRRARRDALAAHRHAGQRHRRRVVGRGARASASTATLPPIRDPSP